MTGIATLAQSLGHEVTGSDTNFYPPMSNHLENMKIEVTKHYGSSQLKNLSLIHISEPTRPY